MKHTEESVSRSTYQTLMRPAKQERKSYRLRAFRGSAHRGLFLYINELICQAKLAILTAFEEYPDKPFVATKIHSKILATNWTCNLLPLGRRRRVLHDASPAKLRWDRIRC